MMKPDTNAHPNALILGISFLQGILMYVLYRALEANRWPAEDPVWLVTLACALGTIPVFFVLLIDADNRNKALRFVAIYGVVITLAGAYAGWQFLPVDVISNQAEYAAFILTMGIATFKALMYSQVLGKGEGITYAALFHYSWRNMLLFGLAVLFTLLSIGLLFLWSALFQLIEIDVFKHVIEEEWFLIPVATTTFGFAIIIFRNLGHVIDSIARLLRTMIRFLLPVLALLAVMFICFLPFTGLQPLWDTRFGSTMMLWLQALLLFAVNAVYQSDGEEHPYPLFLHRLIYAGIAVMPLYSIIAFHGLFTRINQYGLTVSRCWGLIAAFILACFAIGYLWSILRKRDSWLIGLTRVNICMGLGVMGLMLLVNSPLLNLQSLSANSQMARVESGKLTPDEIDLSYFRYSLGRQGYLALEEAKIRYAESHPQLVADIEAIYREPEFQPIPQNVEDIESRLTVWPSNRVVPREVIDLVLQQFIGGITRYYAVFTDMNNDGIEEIMIMLEADGFFVQGSLFTSLDNVWTALPVQMERMQRPPALAEDIANGDIEVVSPAWSNLRIGETVLVPLSP